MPILKLTCPRFNSKLKARDVQIKDLVADLSDGVSYPPFTLSSRASDFNIPGPVMQ